MVVVNIFVCVHRRFIARHRRRKSVPNVNTSVGRRSLRQFDNAIDHGHFRVVRDSGEVAEFGELWVQEMKKSVPSTAPIALGVCT